jgi:hypothetical protein
MLSDVKKYKKEELAKAQDNLLIEDDKIIKQIVQLAKDSAANRDKYIKSHAEPIERQLAGLLPSKYADKEAWQSKCFIKEQKKLAETSYAMQKEIQKPSRDFYGIIGKKNQPAEVAKKIKEVYDGIFRFGKFFTTDQKVQREAGQVGTSYLVFDKAANGGLDFFWITYKNALPDHEAIDDFDNSKYFGYEQKELLADVYNNKEYSKQARQQLIMETSGKGVKLDSDQKNDKLEFDIQEFSEDLYKTTNLIIFWIRLPIEIEEEIDGEIQKIQKLEWRKIVIADQKIILLNKKDLFGFIPAAACTIIPMLYSVYGEGYLSKTVGLQDYINDFVNIALDRVKKGSFPATLRERGAIAATEALDVDPNGETIVEDGKINAIKVLPLANPNVTDILQMLVFLFAKVEDLSGFNKQSQGTATTSGDKETLGQSEMKLRASERRVFVVSAENEESYYIPLFSKIFKCLSQGIITQEFVNDVLGMDENKIPLLNPDTNQAIIDPETNQPAIETETKPLLDISTIGKYNYEFVCTGTTQYLQKMLKEARFEKWMNRIAADPQFREHVKYDKVIQRYTQYIDIEKSEELLRDEKEMAELEKAVIMRFKEELLKAKMAQRAQSAA